MANFDSAWLVYGALLLLLATSFVVRIDYARIGLAAAALVALPLALLRGPDLGFGLLVLGILVVNLAILARLWLRGATIRFSSEEETMRHQHFAGLTAAFARDLIDQGHWISARRGEVLIRENQAVPSLFYLAEGNATVMRDGVEIANLAPGTLIGEATVLDGAQATGTVRLGSDARLWFVPAAVLRAYLAVHPHVAGALNEGFARALRGKLASANARLADRAPIDAAMG